MKARIKGFDDPFKEIETLTMKGVNGTYFVDDVEFEQDRWQEPCKLNPKKDLSNPIDYWQDLRARTAIAAMQSIIPTQKGEYMMCDEHKQYDDCACEAVKYADALIKKLKGE